MPSDDELMALGAQMVQSQAAVAEPPLSPAQTAIRQAFLPTALSTIGAGVGMGVPLPGASVALSSIGSGVGTLGNFALGLEEPSLATLGTSMAMPAGIGAATNLAKTALKFFPAGRAAQTLNSLAPEEAASAMAKLEPIVKSKDLFMQATSNGAQILLNKGVQAIDDMVSSLKQSTIAEKARVPVVNALTRLKNKVAPQGNTISPKDLQAELEGLGDMISSAEGSVRGSLKQVYKGMMKDLDDAADIASRQFGQPAAEALKYARMTFKKEAVIREMKDAIDKATKSLRGQGPQTQFNGNVVLNELKKNDFYTQAFTLPERANIESLFLKLNKIPALSPATNQQAGSYQIARILGSASTGGGAGFAMGGPVGGGVGTAVGASLPPMVDFAKNLSLAMSLDTGRALLKQLLTNSKGSITPAVASVISAFARSAAAGPEEMAETN